MRAKLAHFVGHLPTIADAAIEDAASPAAEEEVSEEKADESEEPEEPKPTDEPEPESLLDTEVYPYEDERQAVKSNVRIDADESSGALTLSYPIKIPPGRNGMEPSVSLSYNSRSQENVNVAGFGWSVDIPYIERINRKGAETLFSDFYFRSSWDDELATTTVGNSELYGAKIENGAFRKYQYISQQYWKVTDKNGTIYTFGTTTDTRLDDPNNSARVFRWMLEKVQDANGNSITYSYTKDRGQIYPSKINYTRSASDPGIFEIEFLTESRSDVATSTASGFAVVSRYRINEIQTKVNSNWVRKYELDYTTADNGVRSLLSSITETGKDEASGETLSLPATQFTYRSSTKTWTEDTDYATSSFSHFTNNLSVDIGVRIADLNGDGLFDMLQLKGENTVDFKRAFMNNGDGTGWTEVSYASSSLPLFIRTDGKDNGVRIADVNGDGLPDLIESREEATRHVYINTTTTTTNWIEDTNYVGNYPYFISSDGNNEHGVRIFDVNGDGLSDIVQSRSDIPTPIRHVYINDGDGTGWTENTNYVADYPLFTSSVDQGVRIEDINGDGFNDLIKSQNLNAPFNKHVYINDGDGTGWTEDLTYGTTSYPTFAEASTTADLGVRLADLNGDGLPDIIKSIEDSPAHNRHVYINDGDGTGWTESSPYLNNYIPVIASSTGVDLGVRFADFNGDGLNDIIEGFYNDDTVTLTKHVYIKNGEKADLLAQVRSSAGAETNITYKGSAEFRDANGGFSNPRLPLNIDLVDAIGVNDGFGNIGTTTYTYGGGYYYFNNPYDRQFALFATTTRTDPLGFVTKTFYHQGDATNTAFGEFNDSIAKRGKPYRTEVYDASGNLALQEQTPENLR